MMGHNSSQLLTKVQENTADMSDDKQAMLVQSKLKTHLFNLTHQAHVFFSYFNWFSKPSLGVVKGAYQIKFILLLGTVSFNVSLQFVNSWTANHRI